MYTYTHSSEKMVILPLFLLFPQWRRFCLHRLCAYIKINRAYTFLSQTPTLRPAKTSFVTCNAFNVYSFVWFCRAIARSSSPRSSLNVTSAFNDYTEHGGAFLPLTTRRAPLTFLFLYTHTTRKRGETKNESLKKSDSKETKKE